jgi:hypothetical protein
VLSVEMAEATHLMDDLPEALRRGLSAVFGRIASRDADGAQQRRLEELLVEALRVGHAGDD